jgi:hypothetical protein
MDIDKEFIRSILRDGIPAYRSAVERGITSEKLFDEGRLAWDFCSKHVKEYGVLPSLELLLGTVTDSKGEQIDLSAGLFDSTEALRDKILERAVLNILIDGTKQIHEKVNQRSAKEAAEVFSEIHRKLLKESLSIAKVESLFSLGKEVIDYYKLIESGGTGIPTPWPTMTNQTMGWWPEDFSLITARSSVGKTWLLLLLAHAAWSGKYKVLVCTTEMTRRALATRFLCMHLKISYSKFMKAQLGAFIFEKMEQAIIALENEEGLYIIGNGFDFTIDSLEASIEEYKPDFLALDGAYLIRNKGKDRQEQVINTMNDLKRISIRQRLATVATTQFNRQAKTGEEETIAIENIGITDVAAWNATSIFGMYQNDIMKTANRMGIKPLKVREGVPISFEIEWDHDKMNFSEISGTGQPFPALSSNSEDDNNILDLPF